MRNLNKFSEISRENLEKISGGGKADYNLGYNLGRGFRKWTNSVARGYSHWCRKVSHIF